MKIVTIVGARPQFIKAAAVSREIANHESIREIIVHTGQHYDSNMSDIFFEEMKIPRPQYNLGVHGLAHGAMTGQMLEKIEEVLLIEKPDWVVVYGDTNSTIAGALAAKKMHIRVAHVEAGLRSFNMKMPEEVNRILTDRISDLLLCPTEQAMSNLMKEGFENIDATIVNSGDVMQDAALYYSQYATRLQGQIPDKFILATMHRAENTDDIDRLNNIVAALNELNNECPVILPLHPRTQKIIQDNEITLDCMVIDPVGYLVMIDLLKKCSMVMTDSGGLQKEAYFFKKPCVTLRDETEWTELVEGGYNSLAGADRESIICSYKEMINKQLDFSTDFYGGGTAAQKIIQQLYNTVTENSINEVDHINDGLLREPYLTYKKGDYSSSIDQIMLMVREKPNYWDAYVLLSRNFWKLGQTDRAIEVMVELLKSCPDHKGANDLLAEIEGPLENAISENGTRKKLRIIVSGILHSNFPQIFKKMQSEIIGLRNAGYDAQGLVIGADKGDIDWAQFPEIIFTHFDYENRPRLEIVSDLDRLLQVAQPDVIYFRYQGREMATAEFTTLVKKHGNFVFESQTKKDKELILQNYLNHAAAEKIFGPQILHHALGIVGVSNCIMKYDLQRGDIAHSQGHLMGNGINVSEFPVRSNLLKLNREKIKLVFVGALASWHGLDRLIAGWARFPGRNAFELIVAGDGQLLDGIKQMVRQAGLSNQVTFTGWVGAQQIETFINESDIAIGSLALHRIDLDDGSTLKVREYMARGIPFVLGYQDVDVSVDLPYVLQVVATDDPIDFSEVVRFAEKLRTEKNVTANMRQYAENNMDWKPKTQDLGSFLSLCHKRRLTEVGQSVAIKPSNENLRILFVCHDFPPFRYAGAQLFALNLAKIMNATGEMVVDILHPTFRGESNKFELTQHDLEGITVYRINKEQLAYGSRYLDHPEVRLIFQNFLKKQNYDLVHIHGLGQISTAPIDVIKVAKIPMVMTLHDFWFICSNWHITTPDREICEGPESIEKCANCYGKQFGNMHKPSFVDELTTYHGERKKTFHKRFQQIDVKVAPSMYLINKFDKYGFTGVDYLSNGHQLFPVMTKKPDMKLRIGYAGQIIQRKGVHILIDAFLLLKSPNVELHIYGGGAEIEYWEILKQSTMSCSNIIWHGKYTPEMISDIFSRIDLAVIPSLMDNAPLSVQEAFSQNTPVVASDTGGVPEMVDNGVNGWLFENGSIESLARVLQVVVDDPELIEHMKQAVPKVKTIYDNASEYISIYSKLISQSVRGG
ncbi:MAG: UDP-N-acetylglucosamine 2-epimerase (non-hydrolyzing) [Fibrobacterales bacterium]